MTIFYKPGMCVVSKGSNANASSSFVMRVVCSPPPATTVAGVGGIVDVSMAP